LIKYKNKNLNNLIKNKYKYNIKNKR